MTEQKLRTIVSFGQWSVSWLFLTGLVMILLGPSGWSFAIGAWFGLWLVAGMALVVRRGGPAIWAALVLDAFIIVAGVLVVHWLVETSRAAGTAVVLANVHESEAWKTTVTAITTAQQTIITMTARIPTTASWALKDLTDAMAAQNALVTSLTAHLTELETSGARENVSAVTAFELFGPGTAGVTVTVSLLVLGLGNEVVAMVNMYGAALGASGAAQTVDAVSETARTDALDVAQGALKPKIALTEEESTYMEHKRRLGAEGRPHGYREIAVAMGVNFGRARGLMEKIKAKMAAASALVEQSSLSPEDIQSRESDSQIVSA